MMCAKYKRMILIIFILCVNSLVAIPTYANYNDRKSTNSSHYIELTLPVKITSMEDLVSWIQNAMQSMASRIDITLSSANDSVTTEDKYLSNKNTKRHSQNANRKNAKSNKESKLPVNLMKNIFDPESPWLKNGNQLLAPSSTQEAYLPFIIGGIPNKNEQDNLAFRLFGGNNKKSTGSTSPKLNKSKKQDINHSSSSNIPNSHNFVKAEETANNTENKSQVEPIPFAIPFEAYITITKESSSDPPPQSTLTVSSVRIHDSPSNESLVYVDKKAMSNFINMTNAKLETLENKAKKNKDSNRKRQIAALRELLRLLGFPERLTGKQKNRQHAASNIVNSKVKKHEEINQQGFTKHSNTLAKLTRNNTFLRQEFDDDGDDSNENDVNQENNDIDAGDNTKDNVDDGDDGDDDDDYEEDEGSLGSITELLPLAIPVLEDLSDPESDVDLVGLLQAGIPLIQGLSEGDEEGNGGVTDLINMIVPIIMKIVGGADGQGSDIGAIVGPLFSLLAPFIGPVLAPVIGPLIRTISNPPTEGSSLPVLITAIAGPLSEPQQPSGMSPLSIVIAGTAAALLKEIKPGVPGGSDLGAFIAAILSGVITGASAGLSGGSSADQDSYGPPPYPSHEQSLPLSNVGFNNRPPTSAPFNRPFAAQNRPNVGATVNIGSTIRPSIAPVNNQYYNRYPRPTSPSHPSHSQAYVHGPVPAAASNGDGTSSYLPYGSTAVPASSVNPLSLIGSSIQDIVGAGLQVVSSLVNAVFGIVGASSQSDSPKPSYGPPTNHYTG